MEDQTWPERPIYSRRRVLALGGAAAAAAAILAACGSDSSKSDATTCGSGRHDRRQPLTPRPRPRPPRQPPATPSQSTPRQRRPEAATPPRSAEVAATARSRSASPRRSPARWPASARPTTSSSTGINKLVADGIMLGDKSYKVEIIQKDVESSSDTAASKAGELIIDDGVDLMLAIATPEMINPVADQCEANGVPCLSTLAPWQPYFFGRGGDPAKGFDWTYHFFWGAEQLVGVFVDMWDTIDTNKTVGLLCPNDPDGNALADARDRLSRRRHGGGLHGRRPRPLRDAGNADFSSIIGQFKDEDVEIVAGIPIPPDFATFWTQAKQQGFKPKLVTMAKAVLFSSAVEALGDIGDGLASEIWWTPNHPFASSLTGEKAQRPVGPVRRRDRQAVDAVRRLRARPVRGVLRRAGPRRQHRQAGHRRRRRGHQARHHRRARAVRRQTACPRTSARPRSSAASGRRPTAASSRSTCSSRTTRCRPRSRSTARSSRSA